MLPVAVGSAIKYVRTVPATKTVPEHKDTHDAILIRYDLETDPEKVPNVHLAFIHPDDRSHLRDSNWMDAWQEVASVPFSPEGEFFHGWYVPSVSKRGEEFLAALQRQILAGDEKIADLERQVAEQKATPVNTPPVVAGIAKLKDFLMENYKNETGDETPIDCAIRLLGKKAKKEK